MRDGKGGGGELRARSERSVRGGGRSYSAIVGVRVLYGRDRLEVTSIVAAADHLAPRASGGLRVEEL